ncbi:hypothetical protein LN042_11460 [Kitasatospora sp. RB6PN24]|uniref:hypothetical protein n=1 Tax=Kitasatospora humi TaxID=2893891 RepID=UPI001E5F98D6|nr:hypothetical protein [Kitasatospora humi]MCC9307706.1 hypothetical protein [Kitasatospora humi]
MKAGWRVRRLVDGSVIVGGRVRRALLPTDDDGEPRILAAAARCGAAGWAAYAVLDSPHPSPVWLLGGTCVWCVAAWRAQPGPAQEEQPVDAPPATAEPVHTDAEIYEGLVDYLRRLINGRNGVHLNEALNGLQAQGHVGIVVSVAEFGRQLQRRGIPVRASLKVAGSVGPGVHRDDLPATAEPLPEATSRPPGRW